MRVWRPPLCGMCVRGTRLRARGRVVQEFVSFRFPVVGSRLPRHAPLSQKFRGAPPGGERPLPPGSAGGSAAPGLQKRKFRGGAMADLPGSAFAALVAAEPDLLEARTMAAWWLVVCSRGPVCSTPLTNPAGRTRRRLGSASSRAGSRMGSARSAPPGAPPGAPPALPWRSPPGPFLDHFGLKTKHFGCQIWNPGAPPALPWRSPGAPPALPDRSFN